MARAASPARRTAATRPWSRAPFLLLLLALLVGTRTASAQSSSTPPTPTSTPSAAPPGRFHIGGLYLTPRLHLSQAGVDTNINNSDQAALRDNTMLVTPALEAVLPIGYRLRLRALGSAGINYFGTAESERSVDPA